MMENIDQLKKQLESESDNISILDRYLGLLSDAVFEFANEDNIENLEAILSEINDLVSKYPTNKSVLMTYGKVTLNSLPVFFAYKQLIDVKKIINSFRAKTDEIDSILLVEILSMILVNAIYDFSIKNHISSITEYALELTDLIRKYPKNEKIQTSGAKGMMNATMYFLQRNDLTAAKNYYGTLQKVLLNNPGKEFVDTRQLEQLKNYFGE